MTKKVHLYRIVYYYMVSAEIGECEHFHTLLFKPSWKGVGHREYAITATWLDFKQK